MLTPAFELKQDDYFLTVSIRAPFAKVGYLYYYLVKNYNSNMTLTFSPLSV